MWIEPLYGCKNPPTFDGWEFFFNDQQNESFVLEIVESCIESNEERENLVVEVADRLKEHVEEVNPFSVEKVQLRDGSELEVFFAGMLEGYIAEIDWFELAEEALTKYDEHQRYKTSPDNTLALRIDREAEKKRNQE